MSGRTLGAIVGATLWFASALAPALAFPAPPFITRAVLQARGAEPETLPAPFCPRDDHGGRIGPVLPVPLDGTWSPLDIAGRSGHGAVVDPTRHRLIVFGGRNHLGSRADLWELTLDPPSRWHRLGTSGDGPPAMDRMSMVLDPGRDRVIVYGGRDSVARDSCDQATCRTFGGVWALDLGRKLRWSQLKPAGAGPVPRSGHVAIYDPRRDRMIVFGGESVPDGACPCGTTAARLHDAWALELHGRLRWEPLRASGAPPVSSARGSAFYDGAADRMVYVSSGDTLFSLSLGGDPTWTAQSTQGFFTFGAGTLVGRARVSYDAAHDALYRFAEMRAYQLALHGDLTWQWVTGEGPPWFEPILYWTRELADFSLTLDPKTQSLVLFGGTTSRLALPIAQATALFTGTPATWSVLGSPGPNDMSHPQMVLDPSNRQEIMVGAHYEYEEVWSLDAGREPVWQEIRPEPLPGDVAFYVRYDPGLITDIPRHRLVMFGGSIPTGAFSLYPTTLNEVWAFDLGDRPRWYPIIASGTPPSPRALPLTIYDRDRDRMVVVGGLSSVIATDSVWTLSFSGAPRWSSFHLDGPSPQYTLGPWGAYDTARARVLLIGWSWPRPELWALELGEPPRWVKLGPTALPPSFLLYDACGDRLLDIVPGPFPPSVGGMVVWSRDLVTGAESQAVASVLPTGDWPPTRVGFAAVYDPTSDRIPMYGGYTGILHGNSLGITGNLADTWFLDLDTRSRRQQARRDVLAAPAPPSTLAIRGARFDATAGAVCASVFSLSGSPARVALYDLAGRRVGAADVTTATGSWSEVSLPLGPERSGIYFIRVNQGDHTATARAVVIR